MLGRVLCHGVRNKIGTKRNEATDEKALPNRSPMEADDLTVTILRRGEERTFNFAIRVLIVWMNSPAVGCEILCESKRFFRVENSL
jgi:hypothetical protein